jgi:hypothetical protein
MLRHAAGYALAALGVDTRTLQAFMGYRSIANTADKHPQYLGQVKRRVRSGQLKCDQRI